MAYPQHHFTYHLLGTVPTLMYLKSFLSSRNKLPFVCWKKIRNVVDENLRSVHAFVRFAIFLRPFAALHFSLVTLTFFSFVVSPAVAA
jgi:hypothetical protein